MPVIAVLTCLLIVAGTVLWLAKRKGIPIRIPGERRSVRILERTALPQGASVVLIEYDGRKLLLGVTAHQVSILDGSPGTLAASQS